jgi:hypothetical protein
MYRDKWTRFPWILPPASWIFSRGKYKTALLNLKSTTGIDAGFDLYPPFNQDDESNRVVWAAFLITVQLEYGDHPELVWKEGEMVFEVGEHPSLPVDGTKFRRFSSKVTGRGGHEVEVIIKRVAAMAQRHFGNRVYYWSEYGDFPNTKYNWNDVHAAAGHGNAPKLSAIPFDTVATAVLTAFEHIHEGMDGLWLKEASFPENEGYRIEQEQRGFNKVNRMQDWTSYGQGYEEARAYWAARTNNNCYAINGALFNILKILDQNGISKISVCSNHKVKVIKISDISSRRIGLTPHHVGTIVEPPLVSRVPSSPDGETYHEFLVGSLEEEGTSYVLDCAAAQFGVEAYFPFASDELVPYLRNLGTHRILRKPEQTSFGLLDSFVAYKVECCTKWAIRALKGYWLESEP